MSALDEFAWEGSSSPQHTLKQAEPTQGDSGDRLSSQKEDVRLGADEELAASLTGGVPELPPILLTICACASPLNVQPDDGFLVHLSKAVVQPILEEQHPPVSNSAIVTLSPGKKRLLPLPPNNSFKKGKLLNSSLGLPSNVSFLFDTQLDQKPVCQEDQCLETAIPGPHLTWGQFSQMKHEAHRSTLKLQSGDMNGNQSSLSTRAGSPIVVPLHVQDLESEKGPDNNVGPARILIQAERLDYAQVLMHSNWKTQVSLHADGFGIKQGSHTSSSNSKAFMHPDLQALMSRVCQDTVAQLNSSEGDSVLTANSMLPTMDSHHLKARLETSKTSHVIKKIQREAKAEKGIRSALRQSSKVVMVASTPSLLKFFKGAPTL